MAKENTYADKCTRDAQLQLFQSYQFKRPRLQAIRRYRAAYNNERQRQFRVRYSAPLPVFSGMVDTLQADLDDALIMKFEATDPADYLAALKANAALEKESTSMKATAQWARKWRLARQEAILTGRGIFNIGASKENGYSSYLNNVVFEDFHFEPRGGYNLENHLFCGQANIWVTKQQLLDGAKDGLYDMGQVKKLTDYTDTQFKYRGYLEWEEESRFRPLGLTPDLANWVGQPVYNLIQWEFEKDGKRYHCLFEYLTGTWVRFEKLDDVSSSGLYSWVSFATHEDAKNFASKGFADDLYPHAQTITDLFNEDMENRRRRNSNARAYDKDMFTNVQELQEAQTGRDALVRADTKGGTRRIQEGIYAFETPEITGTVDLIKFLEDEVGKNLGVNDSQQGKEDQVSKKVGVAVMENNNINKRLSFESQPLIEAGKQLAIRFFAGLKDYLTEPLSIRILGENGFQWDYLRRIDLNTKRDFEISVASKSQSDQRDALAQQDRQKALEMTAQSPNVNDRVRTEFVFRDVGHYEETEIAMLMDTSGDATKESDSIASAAIQSMMLGKMPAINYKADYWFLRRIHDFMQGNMDDKRVKKNFDRFMQYIQMHEQIATQNMAQKARDDYFSGKRAMMAAGQPGQQPGGGPGNPLMPAPAMPTPTPLLPMQ